MALELWSIPAASIVGFFDTEAQALAAVREALECHGPEYVTDLALGREDSRGRSKPIAQGADLLKLASGSPTPSDQRVSRARRARSA
jgi:hypothetical protein